VWGQGGMPRPLNRVAAPGGSTGAGGSTGQHGGGGSGPVITDETGQPMDRGGEEAIKEMDKLANDQLMEQLGRQIEELFTGLVQKQEEDSRKLKEENLAIRKQMVELEREKLQQSSRMEELLQQNSRVMAAMLQKMGGVQPEAPGSPLYAEVTPVKNKTEVVVPAMPGTQERQVRAGELAQQWLPARHPGGDQQARQAAGSDSQEMAELKRVNQAMGVALRDVMSIGEGSSMVTQLMLGKGHDEVVGIITAGGALPSVAE
jgi:hypothetical protein